MRFKQQKKSKKEKKWKKGIKKFMKKTLKGAKKGMKSASTVASQVDRKSCKADNCTDPIEALLVVLFKTLVVALFKVFSKCYKSGKMPKFKHLWKQLRLGI